MKGKEKELAEGFSWALLKVKVGGRGDWRKVLSWDSLFVLLCMGVNLLCLVSFAQDSAEFTRLFNGYHYTEKKQNKNEFQPSVKVSDLPATVDWRTKGYVTEVKNQVCVCVCVCICMCVCVCLCLCVCCVSGEEEEKKYQNYGSSKLSLAIGL